MHSNASTVTIALAFAAIFGVPASAMAQGERVGQALPDFSGVWEAGGFDAPRKGRGGVAMHPDYQMRGTRNSARVRQTPIPGIADITDPILKPWAVEQLRDIVERRIGGEDIPDARPQCMPMGTPMMLSQGGLRIFLQTDDKVTILYEELPEVRHIHLNVPHSDDFVPNFFGESIGHYEGGDTLVVDTIGISTETWLDELLTPHTTSIRVTERYTLIGDGNILEVEFMVEDPETFNEAWGGIVLAERRAPGSHMDTDIYEIRCSENNFDVFSGQAMAMPTATIVEF